MKKATLTIACALCAAALALQAGETRETKTEELFNGKDLSGWNFKLEDNSDAGEVFGVENGTIRVRGKPFGYMYTKKEYSNFRLHVEWKYPNERGNSGIFVFVQEPAAVWPNAVECQLFKDRAGDFVLLGGSDVKEFQMPASGKRPKFPVVKKLSDIDDCPAKEWNSADIICKDGKITVYINGVLKNVGHSVGHKSGHIGLQSVGELILFRNVRLTPLE